MRDIVGRGGGKETGGLQGRRSPTVGHHGELGYRRTGICGFVRHSLQRGLQVFGRVGKGKRKGVQNLT